MEHTSWKQTYQLRRRATERPSTPLLSSVTTECWDVRLPGSRATGEPGYERTTGLLIQLSLHLSQHYHRKCQLPVEMSDQRDLFTSSSLRVVCDPRILNWYNRSVSSKFWAR